MGCTQDNYIPSREDFYEAFDGQHAEWADRLGLPDVPEVLEPEIDDEVFSPQSTHDQMRDCGHKLSDFE
ncbi:hypothetical protein [Halobacillus karajensis]|nr:hypothetical protein [Halobacillus karajensis]